jgi:hypothetical protein
MSKKILGALSILPGSALTAVLLLAATSAAAQVQHKDSEPDAKAITTTQAAEASSKGADSEMQSRELGEFDLEPLRIGDATQSLLAWQRGGEIASPSPRPIAGTVANRSYERYLKSFEFAIPEHLGSTVTKSNSGAGGTSSGSR